jgi:hypothetical protein
MISQMDDNREKFIKQFRQDMLNYLTDNDGAEMRRLYRDKGKLTKKGRRDFEIMCKHPALKRFVPH